MNEDLRHERLLHDFGEGLRSDGFFFLFQPIVDVLQGELHGLEALIHWDHNIYGRLGPHTILPLAKELGLVTQVETWKVEEAFRQNSRCPIHINLSTQSLLDSAFLEYLLDKLRSRYGQTVLELTENTNAYLPQQVVTSLLQTNVRLCIDQFGLGQSSFARLAALPFSSLKIDKSFVARSVVDIEGASICIGIIKLSKGLNLDVISDGITQSEQARILFRNGCHLMQGDWLSGPVSLAAAESLDWKSFRMTSGDKYVSALQNTEHHAEISTEMVLELDAENRLVRVPHSFCRFTGYPAATLLHHPFIDLVPEDSHRPCQDSLSRLKERGRLENAVIDLRCADGTRKCVSLSGSGATAQDPSTYLFIEENEAYDQKIKDLRGLQGAYSILFDDNPMATVIWRQDLEILDWNREAAATFGWSREEAVGRNLFKLILRDDHGQRTSNLLKLSDSDSIEESVCANVTKSGERIICRWVNRAIRDNAGQVRFHVSIAKNITRELLMNDRIRQLSNAIEKSGNAVVVTNTSGIILWVNKRYLEMTGYGEPEVIGQPLRQINGVEASLRENGTVDWAPAGKPKEDPSSESESTTRVLERNFRHKDGSLYWTRTTIVCIESAYDLETSSMSIIQDLSKEKSQEEAANAMHRKLIDQDKMATLGSMLAGITHEIFNYIAYIDSNMDFSMKQVARLSDGKTPDTVNLAGALSDARDGITRMKDMLLTLKTSSRRDDRPRVEQCDIQMEIGMLLNLMKSEYKYHAHLTRNIEQHLTHTGYPGLIRQVLMNLIINALYAIKARNRDFMGNIVITACRRNDLLEIGVSDDGIGMTEEIRSRIFEPFFTTKKAGEGTGLGLSISRDIIETRYGGHLDCVSIPGEGTTFTLRIPEIQPEQVARGIQKDIEEMR